MLALWHWHIEISSKCTLACPRCARQEVPDSLLNTELDLAFFKRNFTPEFIQKYVEKITFCGDDGDPIYAHEFIDVLKYIKSVKPVTIVIVTNGSYKKSDWWRQLANTLQTNDQIHFSLDGWDQASNEQYRVNSDWASIMTGVDNLVRSSDAWLVWDAIGFKFNEDKISYMKDLAKSAGFDSFQLTKSTKFGKIYPSYGEYDILQPKEELMSSSHRFEREITNLSGRKLVEPWTETNLTFYKNVDIINDSIKPMCHIGNKGLYINSQGEFYPCCWVANRYQHNTHWLELGKKFNLNHTLLNEVVTNDFWNADFTKDSLECGTKCNKDRVTENYATQW